MKVNKAFLRILACVVLGVALLSMFQESLGIRIDGNTVTLIGLAIVLLILPEITNLSKFKFANIEIEFQKKVSQLEKDVAIAESNLPKTGDFKEAHDSSRKSYVNAYNDIIKSSSSNPEKIMRASQLAETIMRENPQSSYLPLIREFQEITQSNTEIDGGLTSRIMGILWKLVKLFP